MKSLWDELDAMNTFSACGCDCVCGAKEKSVKAHQDERLLQFLMGVNDTFIGVRSNILLSSPLPTIGQAYSLVIQDEKQREIHATPTYPGESLSCMVNNHTPRKFNENKNQKAVYDSKTNTVFCNYCKKPGHTIDKCYKIHGFPTDFKFTKAKRFQNGVQSNNVFSSGDENEQPSRGNNDTKSLRPFTEEPMVLGKEQGGLYILKSCLPEVSPSFPKAVSSCLSSSAPVFKLPKAQLSCVSDSALIFTAYSSFFDSNVKERLRHYRLGHIPLSNMKNIFPISSCSKFTSPCIICPMARQSKLPSPRSTITTKSAFDLIHVDTWGPYKIATHDGFKYFITIVDDFTRATWTHLLSTKSNAFPVLQSFLSMVERQFNSKVKIIRSDNGFELGSGKLQTDFLSPMCTPPSPITSPEFSPSRASSLSPESTPPNSPEPIVETILRQSSRIPKNPSYLKDYICNAVTLTDMNANCFF
ncbi:uncharacterized protein LOC132061067 [Lycium ferocissimum]|uniref:uncharacterized protein LOC132061067 n=1 Tax=Lycium ferocissimum TaxID=112874 RepID=UPI00281558E9|nr:uncharacterized protein LOC132061067 [Lycium ferocissimum]